MTTIDTESTGNVRLTVNITPATQSALQLLSQQEGVTLTEALRRLVGYGDLVYRAVRVDGNEVLIREGNYQRAVTLL